MTVSTTKVVKTGLEIPVKPVPDRVLTEEEYRKRIDQIRKDREQSEAIQRMVDSSYTKPRTKPLPHVAQPVPRRPAVRSVQPRPASKSYRYVIEGARGAATLVEVGARMLSRGETLDADDLVLLAGASADLRGMLDV
jgi:hypothetical protein